MKRFSTLLLALCVCVVPSLLPAQTWVNGQPATWVIGQPNYLSGGTNNPTTTLGLASPQGIAVGNNKLFVVDRNNNRVLRYGLPLTGNQPTPEVVFGQSSFVGVTPNNGGVVGNIGFDTPSGVAYNTVSDELWVTDYANHRVLRFGTAAALANGTFAPMANRVVGQSLFTTNTASNAAAGLQNPFGAALDATGNLYVSDFNGNRVIRYPAAGPTGTGAVDGATADLVLGVATFGANGIPGTALNQFNGPCGLVWQNNGPNGTLYVADANNHRVLCFDNLSALVNGDPAARVLGVSGTSGFAANQMNQPVGVALDGNGRLYVSDQVNHRILIYNNVSGNGANNPADNVLGQQIFGTNFTDVSRTGHATARGIAAMGAGVAVQIFAVDNGIHRVLQYDINLPTLNAASPLLDANNGALGQVIAPMFSQTMNLPITTNFRAFGGMTGFKAGAYAGGMSPSFTPTVSYQRGERVEYTITTGATLGDGVSTNPGNKPYLNGLRPLAPATPFVGSFRVASGPVIPAGPVNFVLSTYANVGGAVTSIMPADFDGDGYVDFAAFVPSLNRISVRRNLNWGNFAKNVAPEFIDLTIAGMTDAKLADINNDGKIDWVYTDAASISYSLNTSTPGMFVVGGGITTAVGGTPLKLETGDFNGDGNIDAVVITATQLRVFRNSGSGFVLHSTTNFQVGETPTAIAKGDFNRDGSFDIVIGFSGSNNIRTYRNDGGGVMIETLINLAVPAPPTQIVTGDLDGANGTDFVAIMPNAVPSEVRRFLNNGAAGFMAIASTNIPNFAATTGGVDLGNINGDAVAGNLDIVAVNPQGAGTPSPLTWFTNDGAGAFNGGVTFSGSTRLVDNIAQAVALADVDADGDLDALVGYGAGTAFPYVAVLRNEQQPTPTVLAPVINAQNVSRTAVTISQTFSTNMTSGTATLVDFLAGGSGPIRIFGNMTGGRSRVGAGGTWAGAGTNNATFTPNNLLGPSSANLFHPGELVSVSIPNFQTNAVKNFRFVPITSGTATNLGGHVRQFRTDAAVGPGVFVERPANAGAASTWGVATGDFNNDGRLDIALGQYTELRILNGNGDGTFAAPTLYNTGTHRFERRVVAADVNNDGWLDLVGAINLSNAFVVSLNNGSGGFPIATQFATGAPTYGLAVADFNGDGFLDVVTNNFAATPVICLGTGTGTFSAAVALPALAALDITSGDFDADGDIDIACAVMGGTMRWYINNGNGTFLLSPTVLAAGGQGLRNGDVNGDGRPDIVTVDATNLYVYLHNGMASTFNMTPSATIPHNGTTLLDIELADVDGDLDLDAMILSQGAGNPTARLALNIGGASIFEMRGNTTTGFSPSHIAPGDFDGDGDIDFAVSNFGANYVSVLINAKPPRINPVVPPGNAASYQREVQPQRNSHTQVAGNFPIRVRFDQPVTSATASFPMVLPPSLMDRGAIRIHGSMTGHRSTPSALGTWNYIAATNTAEYIPPAANPFRAGERVMVTVTNAQGSAVGNQVFSTSPTVYSFTVAPSGGTGNFIDSRRYPAPAANGQQVIMGEFDGSPGLDMAVAAGNTVRIYRNNGAGLFSTVALPDVNVTVGNGAFSMGTGDFDSDGDVDIMVNCQAANQVWMVRNDGGGVFTPQMKVATSSYLRMVIADFDGDGDLDFANNINGAGAVRLFVNNGAATFTAGAVITINNIVGLDAADMDGDGDIDLVLGDDVAAGVVAYYALNNGDGTFSPPINMVGDVDRTYNVLAGDLNNDGFVDVVYAYLNTNSLSIRLRTAPLTYSTTVIALGAASNLVLRLADVEGDGDPDILAVSTNNGTQGNTLYVLKNDGAGNFTVFSSNALVGSTLDVTQLGNFDVGDVDGDGDIDIALPKFYDSQVSVLFNHQPELKVISGIPVPNANNVAASPNISYTFNQNVTTASAAYIAPANIVAPLRVWGSMTARRTFTGGIAGGTASLAAPASAYLPNERIEFTIGTSVTINAPVNTVSFTTGTVRQAWRAPLAGPYLALATLRTTLFPGGGTQLVETADVNNDGNLDAVVGFLGGAVQAFLGDGAGNFTAAAQRAGVAGGMLHLALADVNNDGNIDILTANGGVSIYLFTGTGAGTFNAPTTIGIGAGSARNIAVGDVDADGYLDAVVARGASNLAIIKGYGDGTFAAAQTVLTAGATNCEHVSVGDVDADGNMDIVLTNTVPAEARIYRGLGNMRFTPLSAPFSTLAGAASTTLRDLNGDGFLDAVVMSNAAPGNVERFHWNNLTKVFMTVETFAVSGAAAQRNLALGDFDGNGVADLVVSSGAAAASFRRLANNATSNLSDPGLFSTGVNKRWVAVGDFNNDGKLDYASTEADDGLRIYINATQPRFVCTAGCGPVTYTANISPQRNTQSALAASLMTWQFTEPMTNATVTATASFPQNPPGPSGAGGSIRVFGNMGASRTPLNSALGSWAYNIATTTATLTSGRAFLAGEQLMVSVTNAQSLSGIAVRPYVYSFRARTGTGPGQFYEVERPFITSNLFSSFSADLDNDNDVDIVTVRPTDNLVQIFRNDPPGPATFTIGVTAPTGANPQNVIAADVDNDGDLDLVTSNNGGTVSIIRNNPVGTFNLAVSPAVGANPRHLCAADFDGDGDLDIATANVGAAANTTNISILYNDGSGSIYTLQNYPSGAGVGSVTSIVAADVDSDGDMDIVAGTGLMPAQVFVLMNYGARQFAPLAPITAGSVSSGLVAGNFDADADIEFAMSNNNSNDVVILENNGAGILSVAANINVNAVQSHITSGDFDGDGDLDLAVSNNAINRVTALRNVGGMFVPDHVAVLTGNSPTALSMGDYDGDGDLDIGATNFTGAGGQSVSILINATQPRLVCTSSSDCGLPAYTRAISPQRNINTAPNQPPMTWQFTEQITTNTYTTIGGTQGPVRIFGMMSGGQRNIAAGGAWSYTMMTTTATFNSARRFLIGEEVMVTITSAQSPTRVNMRPLVYSYRTRAGVGPSIFGNETSSPYTTGSTPRDVATGDIDGDGDADILVATATGIERRLNNGAASFNVGTLGIATISNPTGIALGDADNDGDLDVALCNASGAVSVLQNNGMGAFMTMAGFPASVVGANFTDVQWGDMNADGDLDLVLANFGASQVNIGMNNVVAGTFTIPATGAAALGTPTSLRVADVDNDGDMDVVTANAGGMTGLAVLLNDGIGNLGAANITTVGAAIPSGITTGDVNGDGWVDVVMTTSMGDNAFVYRNNAIGDGSFTLLGTHPVATNPQDVVLGDTDGDGDLDMMVVNKGANTATLRRNNGAGDFSVTAGGSPYGLGMQPQGGAFADFDGDGDIDFVSANTMAGTFSVLLNQGNAGLGFSLTNVGQTDTFNAGNTVVVSRAPTPFTVGSFLGRTNLSLTTATLQYSIQAAAGGTAQFTISGLAQGTINMATSISTLATFVWSNAPVGGGTTTAVITVAPTFAGFLNATQITVTVIADPAYPLALAYSYNSSTGTQGVNAGAFNQGQLLISNGRPFNLAFGAWNGWTELAPTTASLRLRAFNTLGAEGTFTLNSTLTTPNTLANSATGIFSNLTIRWLNPPEAAISTQVTLRLETVGAPMLASTSVTLTMTKISPEPQITSFSPTTGATGTIITVRGLTFSNVAAAAIAGVPVQSFTINSATQITLVAAAGTSGTISLSNSFGTGESSQPFTFVQYPTILSVQPSRVCAGQTLTIAGTNLEDVQRVFVGSVAASSFRFNAMGQIEAVVPNGAESGIVTVQNLAGTATAATVYVQTPVITSIQPIAIGTGGTLTVIGTNMQSVNTVSLGINGMTIIFQNSTTLTLRAATTAQVTTAPLSLESASGCAVISTQAIAVAAPPTLTMAATTMPEVGQTFVITGTNFVLGSIVSLGGVTAATVTFISPTELQVAFGANALAASAQGGVLQVTTPFGTASLMNSLITLRPQTIVPSGIDFTPESGTRNTTVTITGRGFLNVRQVFFGTMPALRFTVETPERIVAIVSTGATGIVRVQSTTGTGESMKIFTYVTPQELDSIAAVAFFRATNGMNWATNANWQSRSPLTTWFGLVVANSGANAGRITAVNLPSNGLTGSVTNAIIALSQMSVLQTVNLAGNPIGGTLGSVVAGLRSVRTLNMTATQLSGRLPLELGTLDSLEILKLDSNRLDGTIADIFCNVFGRTVRDYSLREMRLSANRLTGEIPPCIVQFTKLQILRLDDNVFSGRIPEGVNRLASLREFVLARNRLTGQLPRSLDSTTFAVFTGKEHVQTQALTQLEIFDVSSNQLSGTIPNGIAQSKMMKTLLLNNNVFTGNLPETIPSLTQLETLNAAQNQLLGEIWDNAGAMRSLKTLLLNNNRLSGIIPQSLTQIAALERLELDNNVLAGEIPANFNRLANMRVLGLSGNQFTAAPALNTLRQTLDSVRLERNRLTFESLESSTQVRSITYSPQDSVGTTERKFFLVGSPITLNFSVGGAFNRYQWFKNGVAATDVQDSPMFTIAQNALANNSGAYECRITNSLARNLTLYARSWTVIVDTAAPTTPDALGNQVAAPRLVFPSAAGRNLPYSLPLRWTPAEGASVYEAQVSLLPDFSVISTNATQPSTTLSVSSLRPGTRYYWRVRGIGAQGQRSAWSSSFFTTGVSDKPMQMTSVDFGKVSLADSTDGEALIVNFSNVPQTLQEITLDDPNLSFSIIDDVKQVIVPAEKYITVRVRFAPRSTGVKLASSILRYNETLRPERIDSVQNILQGTGVALKLSNVDFGMVRAGGTTIKSALLINTSPRTVQVGAARVDSSDGGNKIFGVETYLGDKNFSLKPNDTVAILVRCTPPTAGRKFAGLLVLGDNETVSAEIRAEARLYKDGDVVMRFGVRPKKGQDSVAPGGAVDMEIFGKIDIGSTNDLIRALNFPQYRARFRMNPNVLIKDTTENKAEQRAYSGIPNVLFINVPLTTFDISTLASMVSSSAAREFTLLTLKGRAVSGSTATTRLDVEQAEWLETAPSLFVEAPISSIFVAKPCEAGGVRLTTSAKANNIAVARPNPVKDVAEILYTVREDAQITLSVMDIAGKQVLLVADGYAEAGEYSLLLNAKTIPSGAYFLVLQTPSGVVKRRIDVVK